MPMDKESTEPTRGYAQDITMAQQIDVGDSRLTPGWNMLRKPEMPEASTVIWAYPRGTYWEVVEKWWDPEAQKAVSPNASTSILLMGEVERMGGEMARELSVFI